MKPKLRKYLWLVALLVGLGLTGLRSASEGQLVTELYFAAACMSLAAGFTALWLHRPTYRLPWYLLIAAIATQVTADLMWQFYEPLFGREAGYPNLTDPVFVLSFCLAIGAFVFWSRRLNRRSDREDGIDAGIVSIGAAVLAWMFILAPRVGDTGLNLSAQIVSISYPVLDLFLLTLLIRIAMHHGLGSYRALALFAVGTLTFGASDALWGWGGFTARYGLVTTFAEAGWMLMYVFWGAAILHPSVLEFERGGDPAGGDRARVYLSTRRAALLVGTALMVPVTLIVQQFHDLSLDVLVFAIGAAVLFGLVVSRMQLIVRSLQSAMEKQTELQQGLEFAAYHDPLTGLANRALVNASLEDVIEHRRGNSIALLFLDLDNFKDINDRCGHAVGDRLLVQVAEQLHTCIRPQDLIGRIGGDEFVILLKVKGESPLDASIAVSERILSTFETPMTVDGMALRVGASIGIAWLGNDNVSVDSILRAADHAMYDAKRAGKNRYSAVLAVSDAGHSEASVTPLRPVAANPSRLSSSV